MSLTCVFLIRMSGTIFIAGRYNKYSRTISQTPWFIDGNQKVADSVEGFITEALTHLLPHKRMLQKDL